MQPGPAKRFKSGPGEGSSGGEDELAYSRWRDCPRRGSQLAGTSLVPFKQPRTSVPDEANAFTPAMLLAAQRQKIGMVVSISRPDCPLAQELAKAWAEAGVSALALECAGELPGEQQLADFVQGVSGFMACYPDQLIGVHCQYGFTLTGFLICGFLVEHLDWALDAAVHRFAQARPPGLFSRPALQALWQRYDEDLALMPVVQPPGWWTQGSSALSMLPPPPKRPVKRPVYPDQQVGTLRGARHLGGEEAEQLWQRLVALSGGGPRVVEQLQATSQIDPTSYKVTWRPVGHQRLLMLLSGGRVICFGLPYSASQCWELSGLYFPRRKQRDTLVDQTVLEAELVVDREKGQLVPRLMLVDVLVFESIAMFKQASLEKRLQCIDAELVTPRKQPGESKFDHSKSPAMVRLKRVFPASSAEAVLKKTIPALTHQNQGLTFVAGTAGYRDSKALEWSSGAKISQEDLLKAVTVPATGPEQQ